ncbi:hypothetical protein AALO_G00217720 [Alosa alosa]|uniref:Protein kinase domain-containing protein n=1 Tax=Alosa alosa TaxID=278164 RepID=A0AAV6G5Z1_9TELE|nr:hypothetical protein AALO_G00217720 [Alosa alosa]
MLDEPAKSDVAGSFASEFPVDSGNSADRGTNDFPLGSSGVEEAVDQQWSPDSAIDGGVECESAGDVTASSSSFVPSLYLPRLPVLRQRFGPERDEDKDIQHEINVSLRLSNPNIVRLMAAARSDLCFLLATEYIHGATLDAVIHCNNCLVTRFS